MYRCDGLSRACHTGVAFNDLLKRQKSTENPVEVGLCFALQGRGGEEPTLGMQIPPERLEIGGSELGPGSQGNDETTELLHLLPESGEGVRRGTAARARCRNI